MNFVRGPRPFDVSLTREEVERILAGGVVRQENEYIVMRLAHSSERVLFPVSDVLCLGESLLKELLSSGEVSYETEGYGHVIIRLRLIE